MMKTNYYNNICPRCRENELSDEGFNALSRRDNKTEICSPCGTAEALEDFASEEKITPTKDIEPDEISHDNAMYLLKAQSCKVKILEEDIDALKYDHKKEVADLNYDHEVAVKQAEATIKSLRQQNEELLEKIDDLRARDKKMFDTLLEKHDDCFNERKAVERLEEQKEFLKKEVSEKDRYIMALEDKIIQLKSDYNLDDNIVDIEDLIDDNLKQKYNKKEL